MPRQVLILLLGVIVTLIIYLTDYESYVRRMPRSFHAPLTAPHVRSVLALAVAYAALQDWALTVLAYLVAMGVTHRTGLVRYDGGAPW